VYYKIEETEIVGGLRLLPDEVVELAFSFHAEATGFFGGTHADHRNDNKLYFTNMRVIRLERATYRIAPYKDIIYYKVGKHGGGFEQWALSPGVTINLPGESSSSRFELPMEEKYLIDVEYLLARHVFKYC